MGKIEYFTDTDGRRVGVNFKIRNLYIPYLIEEKDFGKITKHLRASGFVVQFVIV